MDKVFLAHPFQEKDRELVRVVEAILESFELKPVTGETAGGGALSQVVMDRIRNCGALVALQTAAVARNDGKFSTSR